MRNAISVSRLVRYLKEKLDNDFNLSAILIKGEVSNFIAHRSGHYYFTLKDQDARISCVMFSTYAKRCPLQIANGMSVIVEGNVTVYENQGNFQLYVQKVDKEGLGALYAEIEKRKTKLSTAGYFDASHKKQKPNYPSRIGVISAKEGAAIQDVLTTLERRWPMATIYFYPSLVQGKDAPADIISKLLEADNAALDLILLVRGGGSIEDLWAFFDEKLCITIYNLKTCIITGVGHETDTTLVDFVSDYRAPTPTGAAELATPNIVDVMDNLQFIRSAMIKAMRHNYELSYNAFNQFKKHPYFVNPHLKVQNKTHELIMLTNRLYNYENTYKDKKHQFTNLKHRLMQRSDIIKMQQNTLEKYRISLVNSMKHTLYINRRNFEHNVSMLDAYSPLKLLSKGYTLVYKDNMVIKRAEQLKDNDCIEVKFSDSNIQAIVSKKEKNNGN